MRAFETRLTSTCFRRAPSPWRIVARPRLDDDVEAAAAVAQRRDDLQHLFEFRFEIDAIRPQGDVALFEQGEVQAVLRDAQGVARQGAHLFALGDQ